MRKRHSMVRLLSGALPALVALIVLEPVAAQEARSANKPALHGSHWMAIAGKPLAATAGALTFERGGNAVDAACAMLAASATMWDTLGWGGETQALIHDPRTGEVVAINALGMAPSGATPEFFLSIGMTRPPGLGPLAAVTPGTPGGLLVMLAEYGTLSLEEVLAPALEMAQGYAIEQNTAESINEDRQVLEQWPDSARVFLPHRDDSSAHAGPAPGEVFRQPDLHATLTKLIEAERAALADGRSRRDAIMAAYERFYRGDIADEIARGVQDAGGLITREDLANWQVYIEEPVSTSYKGIDVYKLTSWVQGPVMLQMLNMLEPLELRIMGHNSPRYVHALYQAMNLAFADRDFYYGDPYFPPEEPLRGLLSRDYARDRAATIDWERNDPSAGPGDPYPYQGETNPFADLLQQWQPRVQTRRQASLPGENGNLSEDEAFLAGTTSIQAADADGWLVSMTPSGGWLPAFVAGRTGIGLSQRMQSFDMSPDDSPFNVVEPGKRPRATLSPSIALRDGEPYLAFSVQGGDSQDQNLLQFFLNVVEFGMDVQQASEAPNINSYQMHSSFGAKNSEPGRLVLRADSPAWVQRQLFGMGYAVELWDKTSGPITAIEIDAESGTFWGAASDYGDDYGIGW
ncbi:MAG TPA: gamma-glutamyltransferase [Gammaproteobacteria bacterium]|nr:gamma-glutamyltransferase [Gammaproteobacteria bacterium]